MSEPKCPYAFIDAANLFYGGKKSLDWSIDYEKLVAYLENKISERHPYRMPLKSGDAIISGTNLLSI